MPAVARNGSTIVPTTVSGHVPIRRWVASYCNSWDDDGNCIGWGGGYYDYSTASATINGTINNPTGNVYVNGQPIATQGNPTRETETHSIPSGWEAYNQHYSGTGQVTSGNNKSVFVNGVSVVVVGSIVRTHTNNTTVRDGSPNVFIGG